MWFLGHVGPQPAVFVDPETNGGWGYDTRRLGWRRAARASRQSRVEVRHGFRVLREVQGLAGDQGREGHHHEERSPGDPGSLPGVRDEDLQDRCILTDGGPRPVRIAAVDNRGDAVFGTLCVIGPVAQR